MNINWHIKGKQFGNCNCNYGCPCQFNALPTDNYCHGMGAFLIEEGFFGKVDLKGVKSVFMAKWPGPIHEGKGQMQIILDANSTEEQQNAVQSKPPILLTPVRIPQSLTLLLCYLTLLVLLFLL